jgi:hypothetical protein
MASVLLSGATPSRLLIGYVATRHKGGSPFQKTPSLPARPQTQTPIRGERGGGTVPTVGLRPPSVTAPPPRLIQIDAESHPVCRAAPRRTGTNDRSAARPSARRFPTHLRKRFAFTPCASASPDIDEPGRRHADTSRSFDAASKRRRPFRRTCVTRKPKPSNSISAIASTIFHSGPNLASNHTTPKVQRNARLQTA